MPTKMRPDDWDRLFAPRAPRRGGPLRALANVIIVFTMFFVVGLAAVYLLRYSNQRQAALIAAATARAATQQPLATATAQAAAAATTQAAKPTPAQATLGRGTVQVNGNLRREPRIATDTVVGLIWPGDQIEFLQQQSVDGQTWYRIRIVQPASNRAGQGVGAGTDGWASATLLSAPQP